MSLQKPTRRRRGIRMVPRSDEGLAAVLQKAETMTQLATWAGVTVAAVSKWKRVPEHKVSDIAKRSRIPKRVLRPDLYG